MRQRRHRSRRSVSTKASHPTNEVGCRRDFCRETRTYLTWPPPSCCYRQLYGRPKQESIALGISHLFIFHPMVSLPRPCFVLQMGQILTPSSVVTGSVVCQSFLTSVIVSLDGSSPKNRGPFTERKFSSLSSAPISSNTCVYTSTATGEENVPNAQHEENFLPSGCGALSVPAETKGRPLRAISRTRSLSSRVFTSGFMCMSGRYPPE